MAVVERVVVFFSFSVSPFVPGRKREESMRVG